MWWHALVGVVVALLLAWLVLIVVLWRLRPDGSVLGEAVRLLPDTLRLIHRLAADRTVPKGARVRLWLLLAYLASPIDLVPDFLPVVGYADDAIITAAVLRSVVRAAGPEAIRSHWPGTADGLAALSRIAGLARPE